MGSYQYFIKYFLPFFFSPIISLPTTEGAGRPSLRSPGGGSRSPHSSHFNTLLSMPTQVHCCPCPCPPQHLALRAHPTTKLNLPKHLGRRAAPTLGCQCPLKNTLALGYPCPCPCPLQHLALCAHIKKLNVPKHLAMVPTQHVAVNAHLSTP